MSDDETVGVFEHKIIAVYIVLINDRLIKFYLKRAVRDVGYGDLCAVRKVGDNLCTVSVGGVDERVNVARSVDLSCAGEEIAGTSNG